MILYLYLYYLLRENMYFTTFIYSLIIVCFPLVPCVILFKAISVLYIYVYSIIAYRICKHYRRLPDYRLLIK